MEQYSEKQREIFQKFYEDCRKRGVDPTGSEADRQRALLLAQENGDLVRIFGEKLDGGHVEAYRMGKQRVEEQAAAEKKAAEDAKIAEQRKIDEQAAAFEKELSQKRGREKRLFFLQKSIEDMQQEIRHADQMFSSAAQMWAGMNAVEQKKDSSWGTLGGVAAGITGSSAVGAAVAADTMSRNANIRAQNEAISKKNFEATLPLADAAGSRRRAAEDNLKKIQRKEERVKLHLTEERPLEELMGGLILGDPWVAFTEGNTMVVRVSVSTEADYQVSNVPAVVDGCLIAEVFEGEKCIGTAFLNFPRDGIGTGGKMTLKGHCLEAKPGVSYTVLISPIALWLIEKDTFAPLKYSVGYGRARQSMEYRFFDLDRIAPAQEQKLSWRKAKTPNLTWQERQEQRRAEAERKAEEERRAEEERKAAAAARAKKNKKIAMIAAPIAVVAIIAGVLIFNVIQGQQAEAARQEAYNNGLALLEAGEYDEAVAVFAELGDYQDSAEQINNVRYTQALALVDEGNYDNAISIFTELGDYKDSAEQIEQIKATETENAYQAALALVAEEKYQEAEDAFLALGSYKDSAEQATATGLMAQNDRLYNEAMEIFLSEDGVLPSELSTVLSILEQVSPDWKDTGMVMERIPQFIEMVQQVDGVYRKTGREDHTITGAVSYYEGIFEVAVDSWNHTYTWNYVSSTGRQQNKNSTQSGSIRCFFTLEDGSISFSYEVSGFDSMELYTGSGTYGLTFGHPDFSWGEDGTLSPVTDGWVKQ